MTVKELIKVLTEGHDENDEVLVSSDGEGNSFSKLDGAYCGYYIPHAEFHSIARFEELSDSDEYDESEGKVVPVTVLWPI